MQVQNIQSNNYQNFKAVVKPSKELNALRKTLDCVDNDMLNTYISIINKSPSKNYYRYVEKNGQPIIYSAEIGQKYPIESPYMLFKNPLELFRYIAGIEVGYSRPTNLNLYTEAERKLVELNIFTVG